MFQGAWQQLSDLTFKNESQALKGNQENGDVGLRTNKYRVILLSYETTGRRKGLKSFSVQRVWLVSRKIIIFSVIHVSAAKSCILFAALSYTCIIFQQYYG